MNEIIDKIVCNLSYMPLNNIEYNVWPMSNEHNPYKMFQCNHLQALSTMTYRTIYTFFGRSGSKNTILNDDGLVVLVIELKH